MKNLFVAALCLLFSIVAKAGTDCVDCETRNLTLGQISMIGSNAGDLKMVGRKIASTAKLSKSYIKEICEFVEYREFDTAVAILEEDGYRLEDIYDQISCGQMRPTLFHFIVDKPSKYALTFYHMLSYFDQKKLDDKKFDYKNILNVKDTFVRDGKIITLTLLDTINLSMSKVSEGSKVRLTKFKNLLILRGALTARQLENRSKVECFISDRDYCLISTELK